MADEREVPQDAGKITAIIAKSKVGTEFGKYHVIKDILFMSDSDKYKEDNCLEEKKAEGGLPISLWESYSSFANSNGGVIILGVGEHQDGTW